MVLDGVWDQLRRQSPPKEDFEGHGTANTHYWNKVPPSWSRLPPPLSARPSVFSLVLAPSSALMQQSGEKRLIYQVCWLREVYCALARGGGGVSVNAWL